MAHGAAANKGLGDGLHLNRALQSRQYAEFFERVLQREAVDDGGQHAHRVRCSAVDRKRFLARAAKNVSTADHDGDVHAQIAHFFQFARDSSDGFGMNAEPLRPLQRFAGKFQDDPMIFGRGWFGARMCGIGFGHAGIARRAF